MVLLLMEKRCKLDENKKIKMGERNKDNKVWW